MIGAKFKQFFSLSYLFLKLFIYDKVVKAPWLAPWEGMIIERPLNGQFHDRRDVILTSRMVVSNIFLTVAVL